MSPLQSLTPLRGIAALFVVFHHYLDYLLPELGKELARYTQVWINSYLWVDFFFILSGYLLCHVYARQFRSLSLAGYLKFLLARFARIYPLHIFMLVLFVCFELLCLVLLLVLPLPLDSELAYIPFTDKHSVPALLVNILLLQGVSQGTSWNGPSWSISAEWIVYLLFPFFALLVTFMRFIRGSVLAYIVLLIGLNLLIELTWGHLDLYGWPAVIRALLEFVMGMVLYSFYRRGTQAHLFQSSSTLGLVLLATFLVLHLDTHDILAIPILSLLILVASQSRGWLADFINSRPFVWLGDISYSVYMVHWFLYMVFTRLWIHWEQTPFAEGLSLKESIAVLSLTTGVLLALSTLTYTRVEMPARIRIKNSKTLANLIKKLSY